MCVILDIKLLIFCMFLCCFGFGILVRIFPGIYPIKNRHFCLLDLLFTLSFSHILPTLSHRIITVNVVKKVIMIISVVIMVSRHGKRWDI